MTRPSAKNWPTFETIYPKVRRAWQRWRWVTEERKYSAKVEQVKLIRRLLFTGRVAFYLRGPDGGRLAHRLQLEAARLALELAVPDPTGREYQPLIHLQWALSDLDENGRRGKCFEPHYRKTGSGTKRNSHEQLAFKSICIEVARLLTETGYTQFKADTMVNNWVLDAGKRIGLRMKWTSTSAESFKMQGKRPSTTLEGWRRDFSERRKESLRGRRTPHVSVSLDEWDLESMSNKDKRKFVDQLVACLNMQS